MMQLIGNECEQSPVFTIIGRVSTAAPLKMIIKHIKMHLSAEKTCRSRAEHQNFYFFKKNSTDTGGSKDEGFLCRLLAGI